MPEDPIIPSWKISAEADLLDKLRMYYRAKNPETQVLPPAGFIPDPLIIGDPDFVRRARFLANLDSRVKMRTGSIIQGPDSPSMLMMQSEGRPIDAYEKTP